MGYYADANQRPRLIAGLRAIAAFLEQHPDVPAPTWASVEVFTRGSDEAKRHEIDRISALIGTDVPPETSESGHYSTSRLFGPVDYRAVAVPNTVLAHYKALMTYDGSVSADASEEM